MEAALEKLKDQTQSVKGEKTTSSAPSSSANLINPAPSAEKTVIPSGRDYSIPPSYHWQRDLLFIRMTQLISFSEPYFGVDFATLMQRQASSPNPYLSSLKVPAFLYEAVRALEATGLTQVGMFRIAGDKKRVKEIRLGLDYGSPYLLSEEINHRGLSPMSFDFLGF